jgi:hypothetical protein
MKNDASLAAEGIRLSEDRTRTKNWKRWGPYLSERQWRYAKTILVTATAGITFLTTTLEAEFTAGAKTVYSDSLIASAGFVLRSHSGIGIPSSVWHPLGVSRASRLSIYLSRR